MKDGGVYILSSQWLRFITPTIYLLAHSGSIWPNTHTLRSPALRACLSGQTLTYPHVHLLPLLSLQLQGPVLVAVIPSWLYTFIPCCSDLYAALIEISQVE